MWDRHRAHHVQQSLFGGDKAVRVWDLLGERSIPPFGAALACELEPLGRVGAHLQDHFHEIVIVVEGSGTAFVDQQPIVLVPGVVVSLRRGQTLSLANASESAPLRYIIVKAGSS